ncbi:MAG: hypothetical protein IPP25_10065 [Saprospiraceae bacterium]|nr:hypothetical protein [Candidatus Opimibacter skivensis]
MLDKHSLRFRPNGDLWECNDGGIYAPYDHGDTWIDKTNGIAISQMYRLGVSATDPDEVVTGLQDNGSKLHSGTGWQHVNSGDGMKASSIIRITTYNTRLLRAAVYFARWIVGQVHGILNRMPQEEVLGSSPTLWTLRIRESSMGL